MRRVELVSREANVYPRNRPERQDEIEGALGDGSYFESTFGYYAHAVGPETAKVSAGWEQRLVPVRNENMRALRGTVEGIVARAAKKDVSR